MLQQQLDREQVDEIVEDAAAKQLRKRARKQYGDLLFTTRSGLPVDWNNMRANYKRIYKRAGIEKPLKPYVLKHTYMTLGLDDGVPIEVLAETVGHADGGTLARKVYISSRTSRQKPAADAAGKRLRALTEEA